MVAPKRFQYSWKGKSTRSDAKKQQLVTGLNKYVIYIIIMYELHKHASIQFVLSSIFLLKNKIKFCTEKQIYAFNKYQNNEILKKK